jgi:hypothetical protein
LEIEWDFFKTNLINLFSFFTRNNKAFPNFITWFSIFIFVEDEIDFCGIFISTTLLKNFIFLINVFEVFSSFLNKSTTPQVFFDAINE